MASALVVRYHYTEMTDLSQMRSEAEILAPRASMRQSVLVEVESAPLLMRLCLESWHFGPVMGELF